jgi:sulfatase-like protein
MVLFNRQPIKCLPLASSLPDLSLHLKVVTVDPGLTSAASAPADVRGPWWGRLQLNSPNAMLIAGGLLLPNLLSLASLVPTVDLELPPRSAAIALYASLAILARRIPFALTGLLFLGLLAFDMVRTLSLMFRLAPTELMLALDQANRIHLFASPLYLTLIGALVTGTLAALACLARRSLLVRGNALALFTLALAFGVIDYARNVSLHYQFGSILDRDQPVESAATSSGFMASAGANGRNVVMVMVESLGYVLDPAARNRIAAPLYDATIAKDYVVTAGHTAYYGATTSGEMRELCNTRTFYAEFVFKDGESCLPSLLATRGYSSIAVHAFSGEMFQRSKWYPIVGFDQELFGDDLIKATHRVCGSAFRGACDADLAPLIAAASRRAALSERPRFIYWLTLNTHVPVAPGEALTDFHCERDDNGFGVPSVCRMAELWHDVFNVVATIARDPAIAPAEILVVGDHAPPLWSRRGRAQFAPGEVAWYRLQPRAPTVGSNSPE